MALYYITSSSGNTYTNTNMAPPFSAGAFSLYKAPLNLTSGMSYTRYKFGGGPSNIWKVGSRVINI